MKVNIDGLRKNATSGMNNLHSVICEIIERDNLDEDERNKLIDAFNNSARWVDTFNCLYHPDMENFSNLSDLSVSRLKEVKECPSCGYDKDADDFASDDMCNDCYEEEQ